MKKKYIPLFLCFDLGRSPLLGFLSEVELLDFQVFVGGSITILGSGIVLKSGSKGNKSL